MECRAQLHAGAFRLDVDLATEARVLGVFGPSGSGKTTFLKTLAGLIEPASGFIRVDGREFWSDTSRTSLPPHRRRVGYVFQENRLFPHLTVAENLLFGYSRMPPSGRRLEPDPVVDLMGLGSLLQRRPATLSGGEQKRVAIARALLCSPSLLLLDEPLAGLDTPLRHSILSYLVRLHQSLPIRTVYVTHTLPDLLAVAEEAAWIEGGRLTSLGSPALLLNRAGASADEIPMETILRGRIAAYDPETATARIETGEGITLTADTPSGREGAEVVVAIPADDVVLVVASPPKSSARNVLRATVVELHHHGRGVLVSLEAGVRFYAGVTAESARELDLRPGTEVFAMIKARAVKGVVFSGSP